MPQNFAALVTVTDAPSDWRDLSRMWAAMMRTVMPVDTSSKKIRAAFEKEVKLRRADREGLFRKLRMDYINLSTTGGVQFPGRGRSVDHLMLVTVDNYGVSMANLLMEGILDKTGHIPLDGDDRCFEAAHCAGDE